MSVVTASSPEYVVTLDEPGSKLKVVAGIAGVHPGHAVVDVGPIRVKVAGADRPLKKSFCMIASRVLVAPRGPKPVDLIKSRIGSGEESVPVTVLAPMAIVASYP